MSDIVSVETIAGKIHLIRGTKIMLDKDLSTLYGVELQKRAHSPLLAAGLASEYKNSKFPYSRRFPVACGGELQKEDSSVGTKKRFSCSIFDDTNL